MLQNAASAANSNGPNAASAVISNGLVAVNDQNEAISNEPNVNKYF